MIFLNNLEMLDLNQVMQRLKHTVVNTRGIPHTWQKGTIFSNKTTENWRFILNTKPAHMALHRGTHSTRSMSTHLTLFVHAIGITCFHISGLMRFYILIFPQGYIQNIPMVFSCMTPKRSFCYRYRTQTL